MTNSKKQKHRFYEPKKHFHLNHNENNNHNIDVQVLKVTFVF